MYKLAVFAFGLDAVVAVANALTACAAFLRNLDYMNGASLAEMVELTLIPLGAIAYAFVAIALFYWAPQIIQRLFPGSAGSPTPETGA